MKFIFVFSILLLYLTTQAQSFKPFTGEMTYSVELIHPETKKPKLVSFSTIFTNDTLVRIDSENLALGKQTLIRHMYLSKQYILLEYQGGKYAIQQTISKDTVQTKYSYNSCRGSKRFCGIKAKKIMVNHPNFKVPLAMYYSKKISPKYLDILPGIDGLPLKYYIQTEDGLLCYTLRSYKEKEISSDFFLVNKAYEKISFPDFLERVSK